jgi:hypothetical protein
VTGSSQLVSGRNTAILTGGMRHLGSDKLVLGCVFDAAHELNALLVFVFVARMSKDFLGSEPCRQRKTASLVPQVEAGMKKGPSRITFKLDFFSNVPPLAHICSRLQNRQPDLIFPEINGICLASGMQDGLQG